MIHEFSVENFLSFKDEQVMSFEASPDKTYEEYQVVSKGSFRLLKLLLIYGSNGSGKTNFLIALDRLRNLALETQEDKNESITISPFLLDNDSVRKPTKFYVSFFIEQSRYIYSISINSSVVLYEKLIFYPKSQPALLFERSFNSKTNISEVRFGDKIGLSQNERIVLKGNALNNQSVLASYLVTNINSAQLEKVTDFFTNSLTAILGPETGLLPYSGELFKENPENKNFAVEAMKKADFKIKGLTIKRKMADIPAEVKKIISKNDEDVQKVIYDRLGAKEDKIEYNQVFFNYENSNGNFELPFMMQSEGTKRYFGLTGPLNLLVNRNVILPIDEIESSLHYDLMNNFIKTFLVNSPSGQIVCTTHNIHLLDEDYIRRDSIWFVEKSRDSLVSEIYPLRAFNLHKNSSILNAYKIGKFGAKPEPSAL